jgi:phosphoribosylaminoimidazolecarboxamide formyltransferase/IMP cyclohydrolase
LKNIGDYGGLGKAMKKINSMLMTLYDKNGIERIVDLLKDLNIKIYSTGGTFEFLRGYGLDLVNTADLNDYSSILSGRVKSLHPRIFGGIVSERNKGHLEELNANSIPVIDCVVVDLYPFQETRKVTRDEEKLIEKIDIGGITLIRAAAKHYKNIVVIPSRNQYPVLEAILEKGGESDLQLRRSLALDSFRVTSKSDSDISSFYADEYQFTAP